MKTINSNRYITFIEIFSSFCLENCVLYITCKVRSGIFHIRLHVHVQHTTQLKRSYANPLTVLQHYGGQGEGGERGILDDGPGKIHRHTNTCTLTHSYMPTFNKSSVLNIYMCISIFPPRTSTKSATQRNSLSERHFQSLH